VTRLVRLLPLAVALAAVPAGAQAPATRPATPASPTTRAVQTGIDRAIAAVFPSLVRVSVVFFDQAGGREIKGALSGSGTIISADGYVVTNHHVAGRPRRITCTLSTKEEVPADLVGTDPLSDIAVIKLHPSKPRVFPAAKFGDSARLTRGEPVLAMGSPLALSQSVTSGIVSNLEMVMPQAFGADDLLDGEDVGSIVRWIGHDASIYPGNSGGPLVNLAGEIVGVNEISFGLGGAIPSNLARSVADALIRDGHVRRSWTGLDLQPRIGDEATRGALISSVAPASPAAAAGLRPGDLLVSVNDVPIDVRYAEQLPQVNLQLFALAVGQPARFGVLRSGTETTVTVTVTPGERHAALATPSEVRAWGMVVSNLTDADARALVRSSTDGVRVVSLRSSGPADQAKPSLRPNDIILQVDGHPVKDVGALEAATETALASSPRKKLLVGFDRDSDHELTVVEIGVVEAEDPPREAKKAWVPIDVQVLTPPLAEGLGLKGRTGVRVTRLLGDSPLRVGDVILAIDGDPVRASAATDDDIFASTIRRYRSGTSIALTVSRDGQEATVPITLGESPTQPREMKRYDDLLLEFRARDLADLDRQDPLLAHAGSAVIVESVAARGWASLGHLNGGDLILAIDGQPLANVDELRVRLTEIETRKPASIVFEIQRGIRTLFVQLEPAWK
jgi:serine protease Do